MNINIKATGISLTPAISEYADKRLAKAVKLLGSDPAFIADLELAKTSAHHQKGDIFRAEIHIVGKGKDLFAAAEDADLYAAIDGMRDEIVREIRASKGKSLSVVRRSGAMVKSMVKGLWPWGSRGDRM
ncbi:MAG: ribosome-associated translation inhibitor RaiA [Patescibacteria group bacterium]|nr:ribosome-associated translation inhibitor RaiA [Patescibacteria group bacterium]